MGQFQRASTFSGLRFSSSSTTTTASKRYSARRLFLIGSVGTVGSAYAWYMWGNYKDARKQYQNDLSASHPHSPITPEPLKMALYRAIPVNAVTAFAGWFSKLEIPGWLRGPLYRSFAWTFRANLDEADQSDPTAYPTFNAFFTRSLRPGLRKIDPEALMVSPTDCRVLSIGQIERQNDNAISSQIFPEQVKGVTYPLDRLVDTVTLGQFEGALGKGNGSIYYATLYLAPGGYHRFHAPTTFNLQRVTRFPGEVLSVAPWMFRLVPGLPCINERAVMAGTWKHGPFAMVPVGATSVRSIRLEHETPLNHRPLSVKVDRGGLLGMFEMGSAIVLIFQGPPGAEWACKPGDRLLLGQPLLKDHQSSNGRSWWRWG